MITVNPIPAFTDNYIWAISDEQQAYFAIVDPGDATPVINFLEERNGVLVAILITHFHADHVGGINKLLKRYPETPVYGPSKERIPHCSTSLDDDDTVVIPEIDTSFKVMFIPGHTAGHIAYYQEGSLFCGDTLFANGCGRVFDGTMPALYHSLKKIMQLPPNTLSYCAHEYTLDNIGFAMWVEPNNLDLLQRQEQTHALIDKNIPSVPSTLDLERRTNPFLRCNEVNVIEMAEKIAKKSLTSGVEVFKVLRTWKDTQYD
ncbi:MAG: hydroxyacylglutathione hydrolase [Thiotrichaceae bacterium]